MSASDDSRGFRTPPAPSLAESPASPTTPPRRQVLKLGASLLTVGGSGALLAACGGGGGAPGFGALPTPAPVPAPAPPVPPPPAVAAKISSFALAVMPDTQFYARHCDSPYPTTARHLAPAVRSLSPGYPPVHCQTHWVHRPVPAMSPRAPMLVRICGHPARPEQALEPLRARTRAWRAIYSRPPG